MTFTAKILIGLALGVATGLFLGERAAPFHFVADAFVRLLQMTVLPYVTVSLIAGIGGLEPGRARLLFLRVGALTLVLWALALVAVFLMPLAFPEMQSASFFSTTLVEEKPDLDFVALYIPSNPFHSLANSVVPAVVLFSALLGVALMGVEGKERLIAGLVVAERALARANRLVVRLTPLGLFAIAAHTVGTIDTEQVARLRVYLIAYGAMALWLALWIFPGLVACLTPIPARRVLLSVKDVLITAFMTGDLFIVIPTLIERSKELLREHGHPEPDEGSPPDVIVPAFYNFPHAAKMLSLSFVLFAAWYSETVLSLADRARVTGAGVVSLFGSINVAIPFLLDLARVPADTFQLFLATGVLNSRFGTLAAAMHMLVLALVGSYALTGRLRVEAQRVLRYVLVSAGITGATLAGLAFLLRAVGGGAYAGKQMVEQMEPLRRPAEPAVVLRELPAQPPPLPSPGASVLEAALKRGRLRVGFVSDQMPYTFFNGAGELVGFDVEMAHLLAEELGVGLDLVPVPRDRLAEILEAGSCDLVMSGVFVTTRRAVAMEFSAPYLDETLAFVVPDHRRAEFASAEWVRGQRGLRVAVPDLPFALQWLRREFPNVEPVAVPLADAGSFFTGRGASADAFLLTAERGSFLTLVYPAFSVAVPRPLDVRLPVAYPVARHDLAMARFLGTWIDLKRKDGTIPALYEHWILGRDAKARRPHWSILRDVLHYS
jgi:Na+/H+-dicarboxylate symporter/ABC-type amino acid transport substrate-binding protein